MMAQKKGQTGNPRGRPRGTPNKLTAELRERISDFLNANWEKIEKDFGTLDPEKRVLLYEKLLAFILPRLQSVQTPDLKSDETPLIVFKDFKKEHELNKQRGSSN